MFGARGALTACAVVLVSLAPVAEGWVAPPPASARAGNLRTQAQVAAPAELTLETGASGELPKASVGQTTQDGYLPNWARAALAAFAVIASVAVGAPRAAQAAEPVQLYFGQGCFWHVQHEFVKQEVNDLGRNGADITALSGYAGGKEVGSKGRVCYHNLAMAPDYGQMGHTEVVNVKVPEDKVGAFAKKYFDDASKYPLGRADPQDRGTEYRSAIGLPGGMDSPLYKEIEAANAGRMELVRGTGNDADTVATKKVWIYDSNKFPFYQGEVYHQFHDDMLERYSKGYHNLKDTVLSAGTLKKVECPEVGF